jgi:hypothetical protein
MESAKNANDFKKLKGDSYWTMDSIGLVMDVLRIRVIAFSVRT